MMYLLVLCMYLKQSNKTSSSSFGLLIVSSRCHSASSSFDVNEMQKQALRTANCLEHGKGLRVAFNLAKMLLIIKQIAS